MIFKFLNFLLREFLNMKKWAEKNQIIFVEKALFIFIVFLPTILFFTNSRIIIFLSFALVIFIFNLIFFKFIDQSQASHVLYSYNVLKDSFNSVLYINKKIKDFSFIKSKNWRFDKFNKFFL
jgi:hypothetical protein